MILPELITNIFGTGFLAEITSTHNEINFKSEQQILHFIEEGINKILIAENNVNNLEDDRDGRLGPKLVRFDTSIHHGIFVVTTDRLTVRSQSNFGTMRANVGVYQGKWMYEVQLGSKGVMQLGWGTAQCKFNQESGVGDIVNSYAYDGNRVRKWNISTYKYGEAWLSGDIIGCAIDMDEGTISFCRNGKNMGIAFEKISMGPGIVYFPTVSLALNENLTANFGTTPMRYPLDGYEILQHAPSDQIRKAKILFKWFEKFLHEYKRINELEFLYKEENMSMRAFLACLARSLLQHIGPLVEVSYITHDIFVPFIKKLAKEDSSSLHICLDLMWTFLENHEMKICLETAVTYMASAFRQVSVTLEYPDQCTILVLLNCLCQHTKTRQYLLQFILFDKVRFANFVHVKPLDEDCLNKIVNIVWWETNPTDSSIESCKKSYLNACDRIKFWTTEVEALQVELLTTLLNNSDGNATVPTSRTIFLRKFRRFVQENVMCNRQPIQTPHPQLPMSLCCFNRLLVAFKILWDSEIGTNPIYIPCRSFCDSSINYSSIDRLGGVLSHLNKTFRSELLQLLGTEHETVNESENTQLTTNLLGGTTNVTESPILPVFARMINSNLVNAERFPFLQRMANINEEDRTPLHLGPVDAKVQLIELLDGIILFYHSAAKKQVAKVASIRDVMSDYIVAVSKAKARLELLQNLKDTNSESIQKQLDETIKIFNKKLTKQARHMAWVRAVVYSEEKQERLAWLLKIVMLTMKKSSEKGNLLCFVPEFYFEVLADLIMGLKSHIHPTVPFENIADFNDILRDVAQFLCDHFLDTRIMNASSKDTLISTLAGFASNSLTLDALESIPRESRIKMVTNLLKSFDCRAWAQSNWILVRFWKGNGFAFRYDKSPHIAKRVGPKILKEETMSQPMKPCPSLVFQSHIKEVLLSNNQASTVFLNSLLNQLNWAFSEFIGMVQEIHNISSRPQRVFIASRQLKVCATCFDLAVSLLRLLEMIASIVPEVFIDNSLPSSENLLVRLSQLLCQILNRISMQTSSFQHVILIDIPDLHTVDHFPILTAVIGIVIALLKDEMSYPESDEIPKITKAIISEPSFQITSLYFVLGDVKNSKIKNVKPFSFLNYQDHVSEQEIEMVRKLIHHLDYYRTKLPLAETPVSDDDLCPICYAYPITVIFKPCNHTSCRSCIDRHLLNSRNCFFCKAMISQVVTTEGKVLHEFSSDSSIQDAMDSEDLMQP